VETIGDMVIISVILFIISAAGIVFTLVVYALNTKAPNNDLMGACIIFDQHWMISSVSLSIGLAILPGVPWWWGIIALVGMYILDIPAKIIWGRFLDVVRPDVV
jgi:hypothetical protein